MMMIMIINGKDEKNESVVVVVTKIIAYVSIAAADLSIVIIPIIPLLLNK